MPDIDLFLLKMVAIGQWWRHKDHLLIGFLYQRRIRMINKSVIGFWVLLLLLSDFQPLHPVQQTGVQEMLSVRQWLYQFKHEQFTGSAIEEMRLFKAPLKRVIQSMAQRLECEIEFDATLDRPITFTGKNIPWDKALYLILKKCRLTLEPTNKGLRVIKGDITAGPKGTNFQKRPRGEKVPPPAKARILKNLFDHYQKRIRLSRPIHPHQILVNEPYIYIVEREKIHLYRREDLKYQRVFGNMGQGPREFQPYSQISGTTGISITLQPDKIFIGSLRKVSYFTLAGDFLAEKVTDNPIDFSFSPLGKNMVGIHQERFPRWRWIFTLYNGEGQKIKKICARIKPIHTGKRGSSGMGLIFQNQLARGPQYAVCENKIFVTGVDGFSIDIFDQKGNPLPGIKREYQRRKITDVEKKAIVAVYKEGRAMERLWRRAKDIITIPDHYPAYRSFLVADGKVYVQTYVRKNRLTEFLVFDTRGRFLKQRFLPIIYKNVIAPYPYAIFKDTIYHLYENPSIDSWELLITPLLPE